MMANGLGGEGTFVPAKMCLDELADLTVSPLPSLHVTKYFFLWSLSISLYFVMSGLYLLSSDAFMSFIPI